MTGTIKPPRVLFLVTCFVFLAVSGFTYFSRPELPPSITLDTKDQPTVGYLKAVAHVVVFEEPKCSHCRHFNNEIFPLIKKEFIDTDKIQYTVVPVSFLQGSMPAAIAALCVYNENPQYPNGDLFMKYFDAIYRHGADTTVDLSSTNTLTNIAKATSPAINLDKLNSCVEKESYRVQIERNTAYGSQVMDGKLSTPTMYVNGIKVEELSWENIRAIIQEVLESKGVQ